MDQHPIPRQITTFEFKLIGFLTLRQFIFIAIFSGLGMIFFYGIPIPFVNTAATAISVLIGIAFAYIRINERPLDIFVRNFIKKIFTPSQYYYVRKNPAPSSFFTSSTQISKRTPETEEIKKLISSAKIDPMVKSASASPLRHETSRKRDEPDPSNPFLSGLVINHKNTPLPGILIYIKDQNNKLVRILKSNQHGLFATFHSLPDGEYALETKDPKSGYFFDTVKIPVKSYLKRPITITSKELL